MTEKNTVLVVPEKMKSKAAEVAAVVGKIEYVNPGASYEVEGLLALNSDTREQEYINHIGKKWNICRNG